MRAILLLMLVAAGCGSKASNVLEFDLAVDAPGAVTVVVDESHDKVRINVTAAPGEMGRLIGKRGRTAMAIRAVGRAAAAKDGVDVDIEFLD